jgi:hypothetical protein
MTELGSATDSILAEKFLAGLYKGSGSTDKLVSRVINGWPDAQLPVSTAVGIALDEMYSNIIANSLVKGCWCM